MTLSRRRGLAQPRTGLGQLAAFILNMRCALLLSKPRSRRL
jgi:hypothetical protein